MCECSELIRLIATATKILKELDERGEIEGRVSGKQVVYHIIQVCPPVPNLEITDDLMIIGLKDPKDLASPEELKVMDMETEGVKYLILPLCDTLVG